MAKYLMIAWFIASICVFISAEIQIKPQDTEAEVEKTVELYCKATLGDVEWQHLPIGAQLPELVYKEGYFYNGYKERFSARRNNDGRNVLFIRNVKSRDAGTFTCLEDSETPSRRAAELIVFERFPSNESCTGRYTCKPVCNELELYCEMKAYGNYIPSMQWVDIEGRQLDSMQVVTNEITRSTVKRKADPYVAATITCRLKYPGSPLTSKYNWTYSTSVVKEKESPFKPLDQLNVVQSPQSESTPAVFVAIVTTLVVTALIALILGAISLISKARRTNLQHTKQSEYMYSSLHQNQPNYPQLATGHNFLKPTASRTPSWLENRETGNTTDEKEEDMRSESKDEQRNEKSISAIRIGSNPDALQHYVPIALEMDENSPETKFVPRKIVNLGKAIYGVAAIDEEVFIMTKDGRAVEVFDLFNGTYKRYWPIDGLINPNDMAACPVKKRIFICDWKKAGDDKEIFCFDINGKQVGLSWVSEYEKGRISVTKESNVIVAESWYNTIKEYTSVGALKKSTRAGKEKLHLWHAVKLDDGNFVASFGDGRDDRDHPEICILDEEGKVRNSLTSSTHLFMSVPRSIAVDKNGNIYVGDQYNGRIIVLNPDLKFKRFLDTTSDGFKLRGPLRICVHEYNNRSWLLVADSVKAGKKWGNGRVVVWNLQD